MIRLNDIVSVLDLSMHRIVRTFAFGFQLCESESVGRRLVRVDPLWPLPRLQTVQGFTQKALAAWVFLVGER